MQTYNLLEVYNQDQAQVILSQVDDVLLQFYVLHELHVYSVVFLVDHKLVRVMVI